MRPAAAAPHVLSTRGEQEWVRLRRHLDRSKAFWLGFVLTEDSLAAQTLLERASANRRGRAERFVEFRAEAPRELEQLLDAIEADGALPPGCTWVTAPLLPDPEWLAAWRRLLLSLNHRRDVLRDRLGGLVIVAPAAVKVYAQRESADLWSVRDLLVELPVERPGVLDGRDSWTPGRFDPHAPARSSTAGLSLGDTADEGLLDEVAALLALPLEELAGLARGRAAEATEAALAGGDGQMAAVLLLERALAAQEVGDNAGALDLVRAGSGLTGVDEPTSIELADAGRRIAEVLADPPTAHAFALESLRLTEAQNAREDDPVTMRELSDILDAVGDVERDLGDFAAARRRYARALELREAIVGRNDSPEARLDVAMALAKLGDAAGDLGEMAAARAHYERAVREVDSVATQLDSLKALEYKSGVFSRVGEFERNRGELEQARVHFTRLLDLSERIEDAPMPIRGGPSPSPSANSAMSSSTPASSRPPASDICDRSRCRRGSRRGRAHLRR